MLYAINTHIIYIYTCPRGFHFSSSSLLCSPFSNEIILLGYPDKPFNSRTNNARQLGGEPEPQYKNISDAILLNIKKYIIASVLNSILQYSPQRVKLSKNITKLQITNT